MTTIKSLETKIKRIKQKLFDLGDMHPGSLTKQFNICGTPNCRCKDPDNPQKHGPYYNLSFALKGKSSSRFINKEHVSEVKKQLANYKKFKTLIDEWKGCAAELAKLRIDKAKKQKKHIKKRNS